MTCNTVRYMYRQQCMEAHNPIGLFISDNSNLIQCFPFPPFRTFVHREFLWNPGKRTRQKFLRLKGAIQPDYIGLRVVTCGTDLDKYRSALCFIILNFYLKCLNEFRGLSLPKATLLPNLGITVGCGL